MIQLLSCTSSFFYDVAHFVGGGIAMLQWFTKNKGHFIDFTLTHLHTHFDASAAEFFDSVVTKGEITSFVWNWMN